MCRTNVMIRSRLWQCSMWSLSDGEERALDGSVGRAAARIAWRSVVRFHIQVHLFLRSVWMSHVEEDDTKRRILLPANRDISHLVAFHFYHPLNLYWKCFIFPLFSPCCSRLPASNSTSDRLCSILTKMYEIMRKRSCPNRTKNSR
jgi:hypothetical protein